MIRKIFFTSSFLILCIISSAQALSKSEIKNEIKTLTDLYELDASQKDKVSTIVTKREKDITTISKDKALSRQQKSRKMDAIRAGAQGSVLILLNGDQRKLLFENKKEQTKKERIAKVKNH